MDVLILITGGTFDKVHDTITEGLILCEDGTSQVSEVLQIGRCYYPTQHILMQKDSLEMTDNDREVILKAVANADEDHIVITHGTGTMELTAKHLKGKTGKKTIVLTGAMRPHSLGKSDAGFNLGGALIAAQTQEPGVYVVMNGRVFEADRVHKDTKAGRFDL